MELSLPIIVQQFAKIRFLLSKSNEKVFDGPTCRGCKFLIALGLIEYTDSSPVQQKYSVIS
jgi:hypothetical protein